MPKTLFEKIWDEHVVRAGGVTEFGEEPDLLFIDLHIMHEVTSPQAFEGLRLAGRKVRHPELTIAVEDHNTPTCDIYDPIKDPIAKAQLEAVRKNAKEFGIRLHSLGDPDNGVVHAAIPGLGLTHPGLTIVCGDSHTATHGAFGSISFGIGTSEVEHVLATQTLPQKRPKTMSVKFNGTLKPGVTAKDMILALIAKIGTGGGQGYAIEFGGEAIESLSMEGRMTISNMTIEAGARFGLIAPDDTTFNYLKDLPHAPGSDELKSAIEYWKTLKSDPDAKFDKVVEINVDNLEPFVTWGTNPGQGTPINSSVPTIDTLNISDGEDKEFAIRGFENALKYMDLTPGQKMKDIQIDTVFIGSCTNGRIEDLRNAAKAIKKANEDGLKMNVKRVLVVPGSGRIRIQAEKEGLDQIFKDFGAQWRNAGCSMCLGMNEDKLAQGERSASTSNRNFEGRQGPGGRTHLVSPIVAAATAIKGSLATVNDIWPNCDLKFNEGDENGSN